MNRYAWMDSQACAEVDFRHGIFPGAGWEVETDGNDRRIWVGVSLDDEVVLAVPGHGLAIQAFGLSPEVARAIGYSLLSAAHAAEVKP